MRFQTFDQLRTQVFQRIQNGEHAAALNLLEDHAGCFPAYDHLTTNWRMCMLAETGQTERALAIFKESVDQGIWWMEPVLREDPDLASLQGLPEFETLVETCKVLEQEALNRARPELVVLEPAGDWPRPYPLLVVFHGYAGSAKDTLIEWQGLADQGWLVAAIQSSQPVGFNAYAWSDTGRALADAGQSYQRLVENYPVDPQRMVAGGFSQGGGLAIRMALQETFPMNGFIAVAPWLAEAEAMGAQLAGPSPRRSRGYLVLGGQDQGHANFIHIQNLLDAACISHQAEEHPQAGHVYPPGFPETINRALAFIFQAG